MIYRHFIAPPRAFTQFSHDLIRHPRLSSDAVRLLTWQLSLPPGTRESLSRTAERARIGGCAFTRAKRQLKDEGFVHERRLQGPGGLWVTQQLVSNVPLSEDEALKLLAQMPVGPAGTTTTERVSPPQLAPGRRSPAVGEPTPPPTDGYPPQDHEGNTSNQPPKPPVADASIPQPDGNADRDSEPHLTAARTLVDAFPALSPDLRHIPRAMRPELTKLTACWLAAGHPPTAVRTHILRGLPDDGTPVRRPGGLLRHLLRDVPPPPSPHAPADRLATTVLPHPDDHPAQQQQSPGPRLSNRLAGTRECAGDHVQPLLFRPMADETHCPRCR
ncbi:hypothetical protein G3I32_39370 [Streptomyces coelicoflavus]|uniref:Uncharacterized protein n=1 Tax=Streptomyces coelicoflavus TaxID=285562 RepID=A0A7K3PXU7_9ACTN|nr:hypothetical protein [Streptomyces coelicoflavus]NEB14816.1 hypothetical protein [Streptomyces coelicoflavus]